MERKRPSLPGKRKVHLWGSHNTYMTCVTCILRMCVLPCVRKLPLIATKRHAHITKRLSSLPSPSRSPLGRVNVLLHAGTKS